MNAIMISDLHIRENDTPTALSWVSHFCDFLRRNPNLNGPIFVLGDIIDRGSPDAFDAAGEILSHIQKCTPSTCGLVFLPGNHDYSDNGVDGFGELIAKYQAPGVVSVSARTKRFELERFNFILTDSINNGNYSKPGILDNDGIMSAVVPAKINVLLLHHSLVFEDGCDHTGVVDQPGVIQLLQKQNIQFVFHGHAHAMRSNQIDGSIMHFGTGSIAQVATDLSNEAEQFIQLALKKGTIECIKNWQYHSGENTYRDHQLYPQSKSTYADPFTIEKKCYPRPASYIKRYVHWRDISENDRMALQFGYVDPVCLETVCAETMRSEEDNSIKIVLIADAGLGKSIELAHLAYTFSENVDSLRPVLLNLRDHNDVDFKAFVDKMVPEYQTLDPSGILYILDGYDECEKVTDFNRALDHYLKQNANANVIISLRSNFLPSVLGALSDFKVYVLDELLWKDVEGSARAAKVDPAAFRQACADMDLTKMARNPFYLEKMLRLYKQDRMLPKRSELLNRLIEEQNRESLCKFAYSDAELPERTHDLSRALMGMAYATQLKQKVDLDENEYQNLLAQETRNLLKYSSLTVKQGGKRAFQHNNFREYLVAQRLAEMSYDEIINVISLNAGGGLDDFWLNALSFLFQIDLAPQTKDTLADWLMEHEPLALMKFDSDRVTSQMRLDLLRHAIAHIADKNVWFSRSGYSERELAHFCQTKEALEILLEHIIKPAHFRLLHFCLSVLENFDGSFGLDAEIRTVLVDCYRDEHVRSHEKRVSIDCIASLKLNTQEISDDLFRRFTDCDEYTTKGVCEYILISNQCNDRNALLYLMNSIYHFNKNSIFFDEHQLLERIDGISSTDAIGAAISWLAEKKLQYFDSQHSKLLATMINKATTLYIDGAHCILDPIYRLTLAYLKQHRRTRLSAFIDFYRRTQTCEWILRAALTDTECVYILDFVKAIIGDSEPLFFVFKELYLSGELKESALFVQYIDHMDERRPQYREGILAIETKTGILYTKPERIDYEAIKRATRQYFFDCLFDKQLAEKLLGELLEACGDPGITFAQLRDSRRLLRESSYMVGQYELSFMFSAITWGNEDLDKEPVASFFELIADWETYAHHEIYRILDAGGEVVHVSSAQMEYLTTWYKQLEKTVDFNDIYSEDEDNRFHISLDFLYYLMLRKRFSFDSPDQFYIGLLKIPCFFLTGNGGNIEEKYEIIEESLGKEATIAQIKTLLTESQHRRITEEILVGCNRYGLTEGKPVAIALCLKSTARETNSRDAIDYLYSMFGADVLLNEVFAKASNAVARTIISKLSRKELKLLDQNKIMALYQEGKDSFFLRCLIQLNNSEALQIYIGETALKNAPMDSGRSSDDVTEAIKTIDDAHLLPQLLSAARLCLAPGFKDKEFSSLWGSLSEALVACAAKDHDLVLNGVRKLSIEMRKNGNLEGVCFCSNIEIAIHEKMKVGERKRWRDDEVKLAIKAIIGR